MSGFVWYSFGSDKTGPLLGKALGFDAGKKTPKFDNYQTVVGWGCKPGTKYNSELLSQLIAHNKIRVLNHPDAVKMNRDKLGTLERLEGLGISTPGFQAFNPGQALQVVDTLITDSLQQGKIALPLILLTRYHRGEPIFCYTLADVKAGLANNTDREHPYCYVRTLDQGDEYRIHVFRDTVLCAQKKDMLAENPLAATTAGLEEKFLRRRITQGKPIPATVRKLVLEICGMVSEELLASASQLKKSVKMGWGWVDWGAHTIPEEVSEMAIKALDSASLDMGAIGVSHVDGVPRILSITTAPTLSEGQMELYAEEIKAFDAGDGKTKDLNPDKKVKKDKKKHASPELVARLYHRLRDLSEDRAEEVLRSLEE